MIATIKVGYQTFAIERHMDMAVAGDIDLDAGVIRIAAEETGMRSVNTLTHEVLHAVFDQMGLNAVFQDEQEELICTALANGLCMVMRDNPKISVQIIEAGDV